MTEAKIEVTDENTTPEVETPDAGTADANQDTTDATAPEDQDGVDVLIASIQDPENVEKINSALKIEDRKTALNVVLRDMFENKKIVWKT